ncbi:MAG: hypothetical protein ACKVPX_03115 [Myxococcaceae bacterium]
MPPPPGRSGQTAPKPKLEPGTLLPRFRADLQVGKRAPGLFDVYDPRSGKTFQLYDFELSLARMLDGKRKAQEVVDEGLRLGIPIALDSLAKFVRQLGRYGFLAAANEPGPPSASAPTWEKRDNWDPGIRELHQTGIRLLRVGRPSEAKSYFEAMLETDPQNRVAAEMLAVAEHQIAHGAPGIAPLPTRTTSSEIPLVEATPEVLDGSDESEPPRRQRTSRIGLWVTVGVLLVAGGGAAALFQLTAAPEMRATPPTREPVRTRPPPTAATAPSPPSPPVVPTPSPAQASPEAGWVSFPVVGLHHPVLAEVRAPASGRVSFEFGEPARVVAGSRVALIGNVSSATKRALAQSEKKVAELETLASNDPVYVEFLEAARADRRRLTQRLRRSRPVLAPVAGTFQAAGKPLRVAKGAVLGSIVQDEVWEFKARVPAALAAVDSRCEISSGEESATCKVLSVSATEGGAEVTVVVDVASAGWLTPEVAATLQLAGSVEKR